MERQTSPSSSSQNAPTGSPLDRIGERVADLRNARGWKQNELARRAGCRPARLSMIERCTRRPNLEELVGLSQALDVGLEALVFGDSRPGAPPLQTAQEQVVATPEELAIVERMLQMLLLGYRIARREATGEGRESC